MVAKLESEAAWVHSEQLAAELAEVRAKQDQEQKNAEEAQTILENDLATFT